MFLRWLLILLVAAGLSGGTASLALAGTGLGMPLAWAGATASTAAVAAGGAHMAEAGYKIGSAALAMAGLGGSGPLRAGQSGEAAVRAQYGDIGTKIRFRIDGDELIPDGTLGNVVSEVKNVGKQGLTHQIKQYMKIAEDMEGVLVLYTRHSTRISRVLREAIVEGKLFLKTF